ncbi:transcriptional regulator [Methanocaldococcus indicus]|uniref:transcriptional regulator n=1 Tax=Methanocaldococcus indicus TaxID=213231 RepID=UPI003C6CFD2F
MIVKDIPEEFLNDLYLYPTHRWNLLELEDSGRFYYKRYPIINILATPNLKKTILRLLFIIKDKYYLINPKSGWFENLFNYIYQKKKYKKHYRAKKAYFRAIKDFYNDVKNWDFKKVRGKLLSILKSINPILVIDIHDIRKWRHKKGFVRFINELRKNNISVVLRYPIESHSLIKKLFPEGKINSIGAVRYFAKKLGYYISNKVAQHLIKITNGNLEIIEIILRGCNRNIKTLRELKIPWLKILPYIVDSKYRKLVEMAIELRKFHIDDIIYRVNYKLPTIYRYLNDLVDLGILAKYRFGKKVRFKLKYNKSSFLNLLTKFIDNKENYFLIFLLDGFIEFRNFE